MNTSSHIVIPMRATIFGGGLGLETFGKDLDIVRKLDAYYVWTVMDGDSGKDQWISPGIHRVNRICYLVSEKPHRGLDVEFRIPCRLNSLTPIGLKRQLNRIIHLFKTNQQA